jgi:hypothetical protein
VYRAADLPLQASVFLCQHAAAAMREHGPARGGAIVLFSSVMGCVRRHSPY